MKVNQANPPKEFGSSSIKSDQSSKSHTSQNQNPLPVTSLENGRLIKGFVAALDAKGNYLVKTEWGTLSARSLVSLEVGKEMFFEVVKGGSAPLLAVSARVGASLDIIRLLPGLFGFSELNKAQSETQSVAGRQFLNMITENALGPNPEPDKLLKLLSWLNKGVPSLTESLQEQLQSIERPEIVGKGQPQVLQKLIKLFEAHATFNNLTPTTQGQDFEPLLICPCFFSGDTRWGEWLFSFKKNQEENTGNEKDNYAISFYLNMSRMGEMFLKLHSRKDKLQGVFSLASQEALTHMQQFLPQLSNSLSAFYETVNITCQLSQKTGLQALKDELASQSGVSSYALVDCTV